MAGVCLGAWGFAHVRLWVVERRAMAELDADGVTISVRAPFPPGTAAEPRRRGDPSDSGGTRPKLAPGEPLATISIPRLGLDSAVLAGVGARELAEGVGHFPGTPLPGQRGNVALAGHRDSVFRPLREVRPGDRILLRTPTRDVTYTVRWTRVVDPDALWVLDQTGGDDLTLVTCYPFGWIGRAPERFVVRAVAGDSPRETSASQEIEN